MLYHQPKRFMNLLLLFITSMAIAEMNSFVEEDVVADVLSLEESCTINTIASSVTVKELIALLKIVANRLNSSPTEILKELEMRLQQRRPLPPPYFHASSSNHSVASLSQSTSIVKKNDTIDELWKLMHSTGVRAKPPTKNNPPPDAIVSIFKDNIYNAVRPSVSFSVIPMMNFFDALNQISRQSGGANIAPILIKIKQISLGHCMTIDKIDNYQQNIHYYWDIIVMDRENKLVRRGQCIPSPEDLFILPGTRIYLVYKRRM